MAMNPDIKEACRIHVIKGNTVKVTALKYGVSKATLEKIASKDGWIQSKRMIKDSHDKMELGFNQKVENRMVEKASFLVSEHLEKMIKGSTSLRDSLLSNLLEQTSLPPVLKHDDLESGVRTLQRLDGLARLSMNLPSTVESHVVTGSIDVNQRVLQVIACVRNGTAELPPPADLEALQAKLEAESKAQ